jgi:WD40 repeat protein
MRKIRVLLFTCLSIVLMLLTICIPGNAAMTMVLPTPTPIQPLPALEKITPENVNRLQPLGVIGRGRIEDVFWSPDSTILAVETNIGTWLYPVENETFDEPVLLENQRVLFSADGEVIAGWKKHNFFVPNTDFNVYLYHKDSLQTFTILKGQPGSISSAAFNTDGSELVSVSYDGSIVLWDLLNGARANLLIQDEEKTFYAVNFGPGNLLVASYGWFSSSVIRLKVGSREILMLPAARGPEGVENTILYIDPQMDVVVNLSRSEVNVWSLQNDELIYDTFDSNNIFDSATMRLAINNPSYDKYEEPILEWFRIDDSGLHSIIRLSLPSHAVTSAFSPDGHIIASSHDDLLIRFWDTNTGREIAHLEGHMAKVEHLSFSPNGHFLVSAHAAGLILWDTKSHQLLEKVQHHSDYIIQRVIDN